MYQLPGRIAQVILPGLPVLFFFFFFFELFDLTWPDVVATVGNLLAKSESTLDIFSIYFVNFRS